MIVTFSIGAPLAAIGAAAAVTRFHLRGEDLSQYDAEKYQPDFHPDQNSDGAKAVRDYLRENFIKPAQAEGSAAEKLAAKRRRFDSVGLTRDFDCDFQDAIAETDGVTVSGEWTLPKDCSLSRRILYIHGGANTVGSAVSHRPLTTNLANRTGCAVFAPNYRLMPENKRIDGVTDCRAAYEWILKNGPDGDRDAQSIAVGGDSAGGNLTLSLINWIRDENKRAPDAVFAISPATDTTCTSPSLKGNFETDLMLKPLAAPLLKIPNAVLLWALWRTNKLSPANPIVSPIFADLSNLPPTLVHVSAAEMLYDDARRYVAKRNASGSPAKIQIWDHMAHVWHIFDRMLPEANHALDEIAGFLKENGATAK
ncbi:MAG: alpha/beta hydrolase [Pseudomonadota bacterium]